ncbi:MAG: class I SAM-dependent methyltransferase [Anaerolineae bacterium]|nr:class I SAM-dependent methyltransferase [Anaerolineae bacterium]
MDELWPIYQTNGYAGVTKADPGDPLGLFYRALLAFAEDDFVQAAQDVRRAAAGDPASLVFAEAVRYLDRVMAQGKAGVYVDGAAFAAFIRGGGNVALYAAVSDLLRAHYADYHAGSDALRLLDIGVGDGMALLPALTDEVLPLARLDVLEPSAAMLAQTTAALDQRGITHHAANSTIQAFMASEIGQQTHWDIMQATWSLQSVPPAERAPIFAWCREHGDRLLIAEFDVPDFADLFAPDRVRYIVTHYERGLREYLGDEGVVAQGFLMPVMFGYFDRSAARTNWEGPVQGWIDDLRAAGFATARTHNIYDYFWANACLIEAH